MPKLLRSLLLTLVLIALLGLAMLWLRADRYDYAAAFENPARRQIVLLSVPAVAGSDADRVAQMLGEPLRCERTRYGRNCQYRTGDADIAYIGGRADWISVSGFGDTPPTPEALARLGLRPQPPMQATPTVLRWSDTQGLLEVVLVHDGRRIHHARIKTATP